MGKRNDGGEDGGGQQAEIGLGVKAEVIAQGIGQRANGIVNSADGDKEPHVGAILHGDNEHQGFSLDRLTTGHSGGFAAVTVGLIRQGEVANAILGITDKAPAITPIGINAIPVCWLGLGIRLWERTAQHSASFGEFSVHG